MAVKRTIIYLFLIVLAVKIYTQTSSLKIELR